MKILFCQLRNNGDIVRSFPLLEAIKKTHPDWTIGYTCFANMVQVCALCKAIDIIIPQPRFLPVTNIQGGTRILDCSIFREVVSQVKNCNFDIYIDLHGVFQSAIFGSLCNIPVRLGRSCETTKDGADLFYSEIAPIQEKYTNRMERHFRVVQHLFPEIKPEYVDKTEWKQKEQITIFPGSSQTGILKRWPSVKYATLAQRLADSFAVNIVIGPEEEDLRQFFMDLPNVSKIHPKSWEDVENLILTSRLVVSNDSVYAHLAIWKEIPTIMLLGATPFEVNGVWRYGIGENVYSEPRCKCPDAWSGLCDKKHKCMNMLTVEDVYSRIKKYL